MNDQDKRPWTPFPMLAGDYTTPPDSASKRTRKRKKNDSGWHGTQTGSLYECERHHANCKNLAEFVYGPLYRPDPNKP